MTIIPGRIHQYLPRDSQVCFIMQQPLAEGDRPSAYRPVTTSV